MDFMVVATINPQTRNEHWTLFTAYGLSQAGASNLASKSIVKAVKDDAFHSRLEFDPADYLKVADRCDR